jgi:micrococcal nuclease
MKYVASMLIVLALIVADRMGVFGTSGDLNRERDRKNRSRKYRPGSAAIKRNYAADMQTYHDKAFRVAKVVDGDTLDVSQVDALMDKPVTRIRLLGVDTPETVKPNTPVQHFGPQASEFASKFCLRRTVRLELIKDRNTRDKYGRLLAYVHSDPSERIDRCLNAELIRQGYGYADPRYPHPRKAAFAALQLNARKNDIGLWAKAGRKDLPYYYQEGKFKLGQ